MDKLALINADINQNPNLSLRSKNKPVLTDILIENGKIKALQPGLFSDGLDETCLTLDAKGHLVLPGAIDLHVQVSSASSLETLSKRAAKAGVTSCVVIPNRNYPLDCVETLNDFSHQSRSIKGARLYPAAALTKGLSGDMFSEIGLLSEAGAVFFTQGDYGLKNSLVLLRLCHYIKQFNKPVFQRPMEHFLSEMGPVQSSQHSDFLGVEGHISLAEEYGVFRDSSLALYTGINLVHDRISTRKGIYRFLSLKAESQTHTSPLPRVSTAIHNLFFNTLDLDQYNVNAKTCPALTDETDRHALLSALKEGQIDFLVSGDSYKSDPEKILFDDAPIRTYNSLDYLWPVGLSLSESNSIPFENYLKAITTAPAQLLGLNKTYGLIQGSPADLVILDPDKPLQVSDPNSLFNKRCLQGVVLASLVKGSLVYQHSEFKTQFQT